MCSERRVSSSLNTCWKILLHDSVSLDHMICFCFLSARPHGNRVYSCPQQQVKHGAPKQKEEFPIPSKQALSAFIFPPNKCVRPHSFLSTPENLLNMWKNEGKVWRTLSLTEVRLPQSNPLMFSAVTETKAVVSDVIFIPKCFTKLL
ncbi:hypothetical protein XENORESO_008504 [Xenotaenia resolanae]|uniref:Uncharacterized protein n=1 Tax=Xenotaenia resolanae TaxID=208358 RepID=A0ABV0W4U0_9TELE